MPAPIPSTKSNTTAEWHHINADGMVLGRLATQIAHKLLGKDRLDFTRHQISPVFIVVTNTDNVALTGHKEDQKFYHHFTGYPGGLKSRSVREQRTRDSRKIVYEAVYGMLPKNSLREKRMSHLKLYPGAEHPHQAQL